MYDDNIKVCGGERGRNKGRGTRGRGRGEGGGGRGTRGIHFRLDTSKYGMRRGRGGEADNRIYLL